MGHEKHTEREVGDEHRGENDQQGVIEGSPPQSHCELQDCPRLTWALGKGFKVSGVSCRENDL